MTGYGPLGGPGETTVVNGHTPINNPLVVQLAEKYNKSTGQILLRFQLQRGIAIVAKSVTPRNGFLQHLQNTLAIYSDFQSLQI